MKPPLFFSAPALKGAPTILICFPVAAHLPSQLHLPQHDHRYRFINTESGSVRIYPRSRPAERPGNGCRNQILATILNYTGGLEGREEGEGERGGGTSPAATANNSNRRKAVAALCCEKAAVIREASADLHFRRWSPPLQQEGSVGAIFDQKAKWWRGGSITGCCHQGCRFHSNAKEPRLVIAAMCH